MIRATLPGKVCKFAKKYHTGTGTVRARLVRAIAVKTGFDTKVDTPCDKRGESAVAIRVRGSLWRR